MKTLFYWLIDYFYYLRGRLEAPIYVNPPSNYIKQVSQRSVNIILIQGIHARWVYLKKIGDALSEAGYSVYTVSELGKNMDKISLNAKRVEKFIKVNKLNNVIIVAHSKGGLIAKHILVDVGLEDRIVKVITIGTPFHGTLISKDIPNSAYREFATGSDTIRYLDSNSEVNHKIISILPEWDNLVQPVESIKLEGAQNITLPIKGHHKIMYSVRLIDLVKKTVEDISAAIENKRSVKNNIPL